MKNKIFLMFAIVFISLASCTNQDAEFDNFDHTAVYFAYQFPVRTITLGEDIFDTTLDNQHKCRIIATLGGVYSNDTDVSIDVEVADPLTTGLLFKAAGDNILPMPSNYYTLLSNKMVIAKGQITGGIDVQLTDAFFADPLAVKNTYVIPLKMTNVVNADSILSGKALVANPNRAIAGDWAVVPKDFIFYAVKYVNPWHGFYLRRGKDVVTRDNSTTTEERKKEYVEYDEVVKLSTLSLSKLVYPISNYKTKYGINLNLKVDITLDQNEKCILNEREASYQLNDSTTVYNISASGTGSFVKKGEIKSWGNKDRDAMYLDYTVNYTVKTTFPVKNLPDDIQVVKYVTNDILVLRDRGVTAEVFSPVLK
nr:DUF5627 domain-containing protein [uncultured Flavobacterium sp.]